MTAHVEDIPLHVRNYRCESFRRPDGRMRLIGSVLDDKAAGLHVVEDPEPLTVHDISIELTLTYPDLVIEAVTVDFGVFPNPMCPSISATYDQLIGLSIMQGFSRNVTSLFGRELGCSHIGALLRAMAPVAVQSMYTMVLADPDIENHGEMTHRTGDADSDRGMRFITNSCHVWATESPVALAAERGELDEPLWFTRRQKELDQGLS